MNQDKWFTEIWAGDGSSFALSIEELLHSEQTPYQNIEIYKTTHWGNLMVLDGCYMVSDRDNFLYHEMMTHPGLFTHPNPKTVVIIGGGDCGTLREVLKHESVRKVIQVEIDERVTRVAEKFFPELCAHNQDPRVEFVFGDGIQWVKDAADASIDVLIVDSTDPVGPAAGLFNREFFSQCLRVLGDDGLMIQQSESPLYHTHSIIKEMHLEMKAAGLAQIHTLPFPQPIYPSGWWSCTLASKGINPVLFRRTDAENKGFATHYYNADVHQGALAYPEFMRRGLGSL